MNHADDPLISVAGESRPDEFSALLQRGGSAKTLAQASSPSSTAGIVIGVLHGFDTLERPLVACCNAAPGQVRAARTTVQLRSASIGRSVVVMEAVEGPIIIGLIEDARIDTPPPLVVEADGERYHVTAEREIVLRCGEASITLTRAGKVIIQGTYVLSRSTGYNKIKGAAIDIN